MLSEINKEMQPRIIDVLRSEILNFNAEANSGSVMKSQRKSLTEG
jgi:hypothetical protein